MMKKFTVYSLQFTESIKKRFLFSLSTVNCQLSTGFTLVETMVAISLLTIAIVAPMSLTTQSLASAYYARDQITAFHLAQEAIESIRHARDRNVLKNALGVQEGGQDVDLLADIPIDEDFTVDTTDNDDMQECNGTCPALKRNDEGLYGYVSGNDSQFTRTVYAKFIDNGINSTDEINILVTVTWKTGSFQTRTFRISENLYRWVKSGSGAL